MIEHTFVTTYAPDAALRAALDMLSARGFTHGESGAFAPLTAGGEQWTTLQMRRGVKHSKARSVPELEQTVRIEYDRGRVVVAASIAAYRRSFWVGSHEIQPNSPKALPHIDLLTAIVRSVEALLSHAQAGHQPITDWDQLEMRLIAEGHRKHRTSRIFAILGIAFFVIAVTALIVTIAMM